MIRRTRVGTMNPSESRVRAVGVAPENGASKAAKKPPLIVSHIVSLGFPKETHMRHYAPL